MENTINFQDVVEQAQQSQPQGIKGMMPEGVSIRRPTMASVTFVAGVAGGIAGTLAVQEMTDSLVGQMAGAIVGGGVGGYVGHSLSVIDAGAGTTALLAGGTAIAAAGSAIVTGLSVGALVNALTGNSGE